MSYHLIIRHVKTNLGLFMQLTFQFRHDTQSFWINLGTPGSKKSWTGQLELTKDCLFTRRHLSEITDCRKYWFKKGSHKISLSTSVMLILDFMRHNLVGGGKVAWVALEHNWNLLMISSYIVSYLHLLSFNVLQVHLRTRYLADQVFRHYQIDKSDIMENLRC